MKMLHTPQARFANLLDCPFAPRYHKLTPELRLHCVDEGPRDAPPSRPRTFDWSDDDVWSVARRSVDAGFANDDVKARLRDALSRWQARDQMGQ